MNRGGTSNANREHHAVICTRIAEYYMYYYQAGNRDSLLTRSRADTACHGVSAQDNRHKRQMHHCTSLQCEPNYPYWPDDTGGPSALVIASATRSKGDLRSLCGVPQPIFRGWSPTELPAQKEETLWCLGTPTYVSRTRYIYSNGLRLW